MLNNPTFASVTLAYREKFVCLSQSAIYGTNLSMCSGLWLESIKLLGTAKTTPTQWMCQPSPVKSVTLAKSE